VIEQSLWDSACELQRYLESCGHAFCFIGGIAFQRWGEPRVTRDLDVTVLVEFGHERPVLETILKRYQPRIPDPIGFALQARVLLLQDLSGHGIDLAVGGMPYEHRLIDRSSLWGTPGASSIRTCSAEDLVVLKAFAGRPQDWIDVEKVIIRQHEKLNRDLIVEELSPLVELKEEPEIRVQLESLFQKWPLD
jgi:hypothetical protein